MAFDISRTTFRRIVLNFVWAYGYNVVSVLLVSARCHKCCEAGLSAVLGYTFPVIVEKCYMCLSNWYWYRNHQYWVMLP